MVTIGMMGYWNHGDTALHHRAYPGAVIPGICHNLSGEIL